MIEVLKDGIDLPRAFPSAFSLDMKVIDVPDARKTTGTRQKISATFNALPPDPAAPILTDLEVAKFLIEIGRTLYNNSQGYQDPLNLE